MTHYICTGGCNGVSNTEGSCQSQNCPNYQQSLLSCDCEDGNHAQVENTEE